AGIWGGLAGPTLGMNLVQLQHHHDAMECCIERGEGFGQKCLKLSHSPGQSNRDCVQSEVNLSQLKGTAKGWHAASHLFGMRNVSRGDMDT
uniref:Uncharacterized protein n=1 Tax=Chrysemys picta bellii TaxID=8478 RepID=A0A8C3HY71_CHRPI